MSLAAGWHAKKNRENDKLRETLLNTENGICLVRKITKFDKRSKISLKTNGQQFGGERRWLGWARLLPGGEGWQDLGPAGCLPPPQRKGAM